MTLIEIMRRYYHPTPFSKAKVALLKDYMSMDSRGGHYAQYRAEIIAKWEARQLSRQLKSPTPNNNKRSNSL